MKKRIYFLLIGMMVWVTLGASNPTLEKATQAYEQQQYAQAQTLYQGLLEQGSASADLYYNLGNTYFKQNKLAEAALYYQKALRLQPSHADAQYNYKVVEKNIKSPIEPLPVFFLSQWWYALASLLTTTSWAMLALLLLWFGAGGIILWMFGNTRQTKNRGIFIGATLLILAIFPLLFAWTMPYFVGNTTNAIVMQDNQDLTEAPESPEVLNVVPAATKVEVIETVSRWTKVKLPNGEEGWLNSKVLETI